MTKPLENNEIIEQKVVQYLLETPHFFERHQDLLEKLQLEHQVYGSVSLVERQILRLREKSEKLQQQLNELVTNAKDNNELLIKTSRLCVKLIEAQSEQQLVDILLQELRQNFSVDNSQLWLCNDSGTLSHVNYGDIETIQQLTGQHFIKEDPICGRVTESIAQLFGGDQELQSYAMIPLGESADLGAIVLGSKKVEFFTADMGTLFLRLIGDVAQASLAKYSSINFNSDAKIY